MSDDLAAARQAERELNSHGAKTGDRSGASDSTTESGVDSSVETRFPGAKVTYGSAASGQGDNREIPEDEGGDIGKNGQPTKAKHFEGVGGPEDKAELDRQNRGGDDDVDTPVRQGGDRDRGVRNS